MALQINLEYKYLNEMLYANPKFIKGYPLTN